MMRSTTIDNTELGAVESVFFDRMNQYLPAIKEWYAGYYERVFEDTGSFPLEKEGVPYGLYSRFVVSSAKSAIPGLQAFLFVALQALNLPPVTGGVRNALYKLLKCGSEWVEWNDEFVVKWKQSLVNTNNAAPFIVVIPKSFLTRLITGRFIWVTQKDMLSMVVGWVPRDTRHRMRLAFERNPGDTRTYRKFKNMLGEEHAYITVEEWEQESDMKYPDTAPVYFLHPKVKGWCCNTHRKAKSMPEATMILVATEEGFPPEGWRPPLDKTT